MDQNLQSLESLKLENGLYKAGLPHFPRNFTRDGIISAMLMHDLVTLKTQLLFCAEKQGKANNSYTGEEPGKIFHEYPGVEIAGLSTEYNACDTTALFLIGLEYYQKFVNNNLFIEKFKIHIEKSVEYILKHTPENLFVESPEFSGSTKFGLKVTYWKDSSLTGRTNGEPKYPITYTLAHIQNLKALRCAQILLKTQDLHQKIDQMVQRLHILFDEKKDLFAVVKDDEGSICLASSDMLHGLYYLEKGDLNDVELRSIQAMAKNLETELGYRTMSADYCDIKDSYHSCTLWPFEQAIIHQGAKNFGLGDICEVSSRINNYLDSAPELYFIGDQKFTKVGCDPQLWTIAAKMYFERLEN